MKNLENKEIENTKAIKGSEVDGVGRGNRNNLDAASLTIVK